MHLEVQIQGDVKKDNSIISHFPLKNTELDCLLFKKLLRLIVYTNLWFIIQDILDVSP